jgi:hypothetical protein
VRGGYVPAILILVTLVFAGCVGDSGSSTSDKTETTIAPRPIADDSTGSLTGIVTDDSVNPIKGAEVGLVGTELSALTDDGGRFTINTIEPGEYTLVANKLGYESVTKRVTVIASEVAEAKIALEAIAIETPYHNTVPLKGMWTLAVAAIVAVPNTGAVPTHGDEHRFQFDVDKDWNTTIIEVSFKFSNAGSSTTPGAWFNSVATPKGKTSGTPTGEVFGKTSPVRAELHPGQPYINPAGKPIGRDYPEGAYHHSSYAFPVGLLSDETSAATAPSQSRGVGTSIGQSFEVYASMFYFEAPPPGFSGLADA